MQFRSWEVFKYVWVCESTFSTVNLMNSKYRSNIPDENSVSKLRCALRVKYTPNLKT